jgi:hypothetical protein
MYHLVLSLERENIMNLQSQITSNTCDSFFFLSFFWYRLLLEKGADKTIITDEGERPLDLVDPTDFATVRVMLESRKHEHSQDDDPQTSEDDLDESNGNS